jgi:hypothetical protein
LQWVEELQGLPLSARLKSPNANSNDGPLQGRREGDPHLCLECIFRIASDSSRQICTFRTADRWCHTCRNQIVLYRPNMAEEQYSRRSLPWDSGYSLSAFGVATKVLALILMASEIVLFVLDVSTGLRFTARQGTIILETELKI